MLELIDDNLSSLFPTSKVAADLFDFLRHDGCLNGLSYECEIEGKHYRFNEDERIEVICRVAQFDYQPASQEVRVLVAVGGVLRESNGICVPGLFFAKLYYREISTAFRVEVDSCAFAL
jgi:hypothetical protein